MIVKNKRSQWLLTFFALFFFLFNYPVLSIFDITNSIGGLTSGLVYLFTVWMALIIGMFAFQKLIKEKK